MVNVWYTRGDGREWEGREGKGRTLNDSLILRARARVGTNADYKAFQAECECFYRMAFSALCPVDPFDRLIAITDEHNNRKELCENTVTVRGPRN